ncbi:hypothetical protein MMC25_007530 [Agyrium rufum]|nr:hypothetical protein [Agyrium rufum]
MKSIKSASVLVFGLLTRAPCIAYAAHLTLFNNCDSAIYYANVVPGDNSREDLIGLEAEERRILPFGDETSQMVFADVDEDEFTGLLHFTWTGPDADGKRHFGLGEDKAGSPFEPSIVRARDLIKGEDGHPVCDYTECPRPEYEKDGSCVPYDDNGDQTLWACDAKADFIVIFCAKPQFNNAGMVIQEY